MNIYTHQFIARCPGNDALIIYAIRIESERMIHVEHVTAAAALCKKGYHEDIADFLHEKLGGRQTLKAHHHGVDIETRRGFD